MDETKAQGGQRYIRSGRPARVVIKASIFTSVDEIACFLGHLAELR